MYEENFDEMHLAIEELKIVYLLLRAYSDKSADFAADFAAEDLRCCERLLHDMAEQYSGLYFENAHLILKKLAKG